jgi:CO dehydrogenase maturation factor
MLSQLVEQSRQLTILDMEASSEHMRRGTPRAADILLVVTEPYYRSLETAARQVPLAQELGIKQIFVIANKVRNSREEEALRRFCTEHDMNLITILPFDEAVTEADETGTPILDQAPASRYVQDVAKLKGFLLETAKN